MRGGPFHARTRRRRTSRRALSPGRWPRRGRCRRCWLGSGRGVAARPVPPLPARDLQRGHRAGPRDGAPTRGPGQQPGQPRLPLLGPARLRQDHLGAHPRARAQLRAGPDRRPVRGVRLLPRPGAWRPGLDRRDRDRRGLPRWRRRRPRPAREGVLRAGAQPLQDLHHRRGPHGLPAGLQRPAQAGRGAAAAPAVHLRHDRARQGDRDDPLPHPPLPLPADPAAAALELPLRAVREGGRGHRAGRDPAGRPRRGRQRARHALGARPAARWRRSGGRDPRAGHGPARLHPRQPARRGRRRLRGR